MSYRAGGSSGAYPEGYAPQVTETYSLIDRHSAIEGTFTSERDLRIEGKMRGTLHCQGLLYIAEGADVDATVEAANITVAGEMRGQITCRGKLQIMPSGHVYASVDTQSLVINEGALIDGELRMEAARPAGAVASAADREIEGGAPQLLRRFSTESDDASATSLPTDSKRTTE